MIRTVCTLLISMFIASALYAHKVTVFAWLDQDIVNVETSFSGGTPAKHSLVTLKSATGQVIKKGHTDEKGKWIFQLPSLLEPQLLTIVLDAGEGHRATWQIHPSDFPAKKKYEEKKLPTPLIQKAPVSNPSPLYTEEEVKQFIKEAVDNTRIEIQQNEIAPLKRQLAMQASAGPSITEIIGGVGWILGLFGVSAWWRSRKRK